MPASPSCSSWSPGGLRAGGRRQRHRVRRPDVELPQRGDQRVERQHRNRGGHRGRGLSPECAADQLPLNAAGQLTIATDSPAFEPWFVDNDPTNGQGYESAVAYAVAEKLGFTADQVEWVTVGFNQSYKPGDKDFDFDINQISITPERAQVVDFSDGYYAASQAVITLKDSPVAAVTTVAELADYNLGAQTGTTSLTVIRDVVQPANDPAVFEDTNAAKQALLNGQVDAIIADLPTAFYITAVEIPRATIIGQFEGDASNPEEFGLLFQKGNPLVRLRQRGHRRADRQRDPRPAGAAVAVRRGGRPGPPVRPTGERRDRLVTQPARARAPGGPPPPGHPVGPGRHRCDGGRLRPPGRRDRVLTGLAPRARDLLQRLPRPGVLRRRSSTASGST